MGFAGCVLRAAGHDFMDFRNGVGGSDGCLRFDDPDNKGLINCLSNIEQGSALLQEGISEPDDEGDEDDENEADGLISQKRGDGDDEDDGDEDDNDGALISSDEYDDEGD